MENTARNELETLVNGILLPGFDGTEPPAWLANYPKLAGVVVFGHNTPDYQTTAALTAGIRAENPDLIIFSDEEGGDVTRIQATVGGSLPGARAFGLGGDAALTADAAEALGALLVGLGIDATFAPDVDVASEPLNPVIGVRSFHSDARTVADMGVAFIKGLSAGGALSCAKHFPGHGDTKTDSHLDLPTIKADETLLAARDLIPFQAAIDAGVPMVMTGHLRVPAWGEEPASLNPKAARWLREHGFAGVIVTDAMDMRGVSGEIGIAEACVRAAIAGADLLCLGNSVRSPFWDVSGFSDEDILSKVRDALVDAVIEGRLSREQLEESSARVRRMRELSAELRDDAAARAPESVVEALGRLDRAGARAAEVIRAKGDVVLARGDVIVDARFAGEHASTTVTPAMVKVLVSERGLVFPDSDADISQLLGESSRLVILTRTPSEKAEHYLADHPDAVVIHAGEPEAVPAQAANVIYALSMTRAAANQVLKLTEPQGR